MSKPYISQHLTEPGSGEVSLGLGRANVPTPARVQRAKDHGYIAFIANVDEVDDYIAIVLHRQGSSDRPIIEVVPYMIQHDRDIEQQAQLIDEALERAMHKANIG